MSVVELKLRFSLVVAPNCVSVPADAAEAANVATIAAAAAKAFNFDMNGLQ
jgi:hypothetical protein